MSVQEVALGFGSAKIGKIFNAPNLLTLKITQLFRKTNRNAVAIAQSHNKIYFLGCKASEYQQLNESHCMQNGAGTFNNSLTHST